MPNLRIAPVNFWDDATLTASDEAATLPITNTQNIYRSKVWRSTQDATAITIDGDWGGEERRPNCFFLFRHNLRGGTLRLQLYANDDQTSQVYDSSPLTVDAIAPAGAFDWGMAAASSPQQYDPLIGEAPWPLYFTAVACKSFRVTIDGIDGLGYAQVKRPFLGRYLEVTYNPAYGAALGLAQNGDQVRTRGGSLPSGDGERWRTFSFDLSQIPEAQRPTWLDIMARCGLQHDLVVSLFPGDASRKERDYLLNAKFASLDALTYSLPWTTKKVVLVEV